MYRPSNVPYYVPLSGTNLYLPYEYEVPPWYIAPNYDINRGPAGSVPWSYTYGESKDESTSKSDQGLNYAYSSVPYGESKDKRTSESHPGLNYAYPPVHDFVTHRHAMGRE